MSEPEAVATFSASVLPDNPAVWPVYQGSIPAMRVEGRFGVQAADGAVSYCDDGFLALDPQGQPYAIPFADFDLAQYRRAG